MPHLVDATTTILQKTPTAAQGSLAHPPFYVGPAARQRSSFAAVATDLAEVEEHAASRVCGTLAPAAVAGKGHEVLKIQGGIMFDDTCQSVNTMLGTFPQLPPSECSTSLGRKLLGPLDLIRVPPVRGPPGPESTLLCKDHRHAAEMEWRQHATGRCHVEWLGQEDTLDVAGPGLRFARHFWRCGGGSSTGADARTGPTRFERVDGGGDSSVHKFSIMENGTMMVRREGNDPFQSHALLTAAEPVLVYPEGHYFEVRIRSLFRKSGPPERPRHHAPRTEGLVIGVTSSSASQGDTSAQRVGHVAPGTWCISTSGSFYCAGNPGAARPKRPGTQEDRVTPRRCWHQTTTEKATKPPEMLRCIWPLPPEEPSTTRPPTQLQKGAEEVLPDEGKSARPASARTISTASTMAPPGSAGSTMRQRDTPPGTATGGEVAGGHGDGPPRKRRLGWTAALDEGDVLGLLVTPFGGLVVTVNGEKRLLVPDAGVPCDMDLYPLVEVYNHVRSVQIVPHPLPPK